MPAEITVYTDYVCPFCLLCEPLIREVANERGASIRWRPFELRPAPVPTLRVEDDYLPAVWKSSVYPMAERLNIPITLPGVSPQPRTDKAFEVFALAQEQDLGDKFSMRVLSGFFQEEKDIGDIDVLVSLAQDVGMDGKEVRQILLDGTYRAAHQKALKYAQEVAKISVVPTVIIGDKRYDGFPDKSWLNNALDSIPI
jgi:predicted DsbA family dithiol-disulfide isomerase